MYYAFLLLTLGICFDAEAAYRAYKLEVTHFEPSMKKNVTLTVLSVLDHLQYEHYHAGYGLQKVILVDTWYCPGDTRGKAICQKPKVRAPSASDLAARPGAAYDKPQRPDIDFNRQPVIP